MRCMPPQVGSTTCRYQALPRSHSQIAATDSRLRPDVHKYQSNANFQPFSSSPQQVRSKSAGTIGACPMSWFSFLPQLVACTLREIWCKLQKCVVVVAALASWSNVNFGCIFCFSCWSWGAFHHVYAGNEEQHCSVKAGAQVPPFRLPRSGSLRLKDQRLKGPAVGEPVSLHWMLAQIHRRWTSPSCPTGASTEVLASSLRSGEGEWAASTARGDEPESYPSVFGVKRVEVARTGFNP